MAVGEGCGWSVRGVDGVCRLFWRRCRIRFLHNSRLCVDGWWSVLECFGQVQRRTVYTYVRTYVHM